MAWYEFGKAARETREQRLVRAGVRGDMAEAAGRMASDPRSDRTIARIGHYLAESDVVLAMIDARVLKQPGLVVLSSRRVVFLAHGSVAAPPSFDLSLDDIVEISSTAPVRGCSTVTFRTGAGVLVVDRALGRSGEIFADAARRAVWGAVAPRRDPLAELTELFAMRDAGALSAGEFEARKRELLKEL